jgi:hypothetical protein
LAFTADLPRDAGTLLDGPEAGRCAGLAAVFFTLFLADAAGAAAGAEAELRAVVLTDASLALGLETAVPGGSVVVAGAARADASCRFRERFDARSPIPHNGLRERLVPGDPRR